MWAGRWGAWHGDGDGGGGGGWVAMGCGVLWVVGARAGGWGKGARLLGMLGDCGVGGTCASHVLAVTVAARAVYPSSPGVERLRGAPSSTCGTHCRLCVWHLCPSTVGGFSAGGWRLGGGCGGWLQFFPSLFLLFFFFFALCVSFLHSTVLIARRNRPWWAQGCHCGGSVVGCTFFFLLRLHSCRLGIKTGRPGRSSPLPFR